MSYSQRTEAVIVNVKYRFHLNQDKGISKIRDNILLSWVSDECEHDSLYVAKFNQSIKYMLKVAKEMLAKSKSSKLRLEQQSTRTTSTLLWCSTSYKVKSFLVFVIPKIIFFLPGGNIHVYLFKFKVNYEYDKRNCRISSK